MKRFPLNLKYVITLSACLILLAAAIMGPQLLFYVQDSYRMGKTWQGLRNSFDVAAINGSYESMNARMSAFAEGLSQGKEYYVTGTEYQVNTEFYEILDGILNEELLAVCEGLGLIPANLPTELQVYGYDVEAWKKYVIYDDILEDGETTVVVMAWYIELRMGEDHRLKLLADSDNNTIYYMEWIYEGGMSEEEKDDSASMGFSMVDAPQIIELSLYLSSYYEANEVTDVEYELIWKQIYKQIENNGFLEYHHNLNYDDKYVQGEIGLRCLYDEAEGLVLYMGIKEIAEMISELQK